MTTEIQQNQIPNEPQLKDLLDLLKKDIFLSLNCHHLGTIQSFNAANQTASATINYKKTFFELDPKTGLYNPVLLDYPIMQDCPVICLGGGSASLTFPIKQGDECLVFFNDRDMDNWFSGSVGGAVASPRLHSFADAIILVGVRSLQHALQNYDTVRAILRNGSAAIGANSSNSKVLVTSDFPTNSTTLNSVLQQLVSAIEGITCGGSPIDNPAPLVAAGTAIGNLLE